MKIFTRIKRLFSNSEPEKYTCIRCRMQVIKEFEDMVARLVKQKSQAKYRRRMR